MSRSSAAEHVGQAALVLSVIAMAVAIVPATREFAWVAATPAVLIALVSMSAHSGRKRYAASALLLGWFAFAYSFAIMLWG